jgi:hypothetical protein
MANILIDYPTAAAGERPQEEEQEGKQDAEGQQEEQGQQGQGAVTAAGLMDLLRQYAKQHTEGVATNGVSPWIGEVMHPETGEWLARQIMYGNKNKLKDRGIWYNHSTFIDLIISALFGFRGNGPKSFSINPQAVGLDYMAVDNLRYHGKDLALVWDRTGSKYKYGKGLHVLVGGKVVASAPAMGKLEVHLQ